MAHASRRLAAFLLLLTPCTGAAVALAANACDAFKWDVRHERAVFATRAEDQRAGVAVGSAPVISLDKLYRLQLAPQGRVAFVLPPARKPRVDGPYAGLVRVHIAAGGLYRVAVSQPFWVDVVAKGKVISSSDFTGAHGCSSPHKVVLYRLEAGDHLLQVSGWASGQAELAVTRAPDGGSVVHR